jgi:2-isopropylmalate synthase
MVAVVVVAAAAPSSGGNVLANSSSVCQFLVTEEQRATTSSVYESLDRATVCWAAGGGRMSNDQAGIPAELAEALSENETAGKIFAALPSSHQNEYLRWISEAKRAETRQRRAAKAVEMMVDKHG